MECLSLCSSAQDLSDEQKTEILRYDNGDWNDEKIVHWCCDGCPCGGTKEAALNKIRGAIAISFGSGCDLALEYRWKNMERGIAWSLRCRLQHKLLDRAVALAFSRSSIDQAVAALEAVGPDDDGVLVGHKQTVKAGKVIHFMESDDPQGRNLAKALIFCGPMQHHLNSLFKAEKATSEFIDAASSVPHKACPEAVVMDKKCNELKAHSLKYNMAVISGRGGRAVISRLSELIRSFEHHNWSTLRLGLTRAEKFEGARLLLKAAGSVWRRSVFYYEAAKFQVLQCADPALQDEDLTERVTRLRHLKLQCPQCIDSFTSVWLDRLLAERPIASKARAALALIVAATPVTSVRVEKKHLLGQELRKVRSRGRAPTATELSKRTYVKSVSLANQRKTKFVEALVLKGIARRSFSRLARALAVEKRGVRDTVKAACTRMSRKRVKATASSAWGEYRRLNWSPDIRPCTAEGREEYKRLRTEWLVETAETKTHMSAFAQVRTSSALDIDDKKLSGVHDLPQGGQRKGARKRAMVSSLQDLRSHPMWESGAAIESYSAPLKPSLVDMTSSTQALAAQQSLAFDYDAKPVQNPKGTALPERVCVARLGGLCTTHVHATSAKAVVKQVYAILKAKALLAELPLICKIGDSDDGVLGDNDKFQKFCIVDTHGAGDNIVCIGVVSGGAEGILHLAEGEGGLAVTTLHRIVARRVAPGDEALQFIVFDVADAEDGSHGFAVKIVRERFSQKVPLRQPGKKARCDETRPLPFGLSIATTDVHSAGDGKDPEEMASDDAEEHGYAEVDRVSEADISSEAEAVGGDEVAGEAPDLPPAAAPAPVAELLWGIPTVGLKGLEQAPSARSICFICNKTIALGDWRFNYQLKATKKLSDRKRVHRGCVPALPEATKHVDHECLLRLANQDFPHEIQELCETLAEVRKPYAAAASSGG